MKEGQNVKTEGLSETQGAVVHHLDTQGLICPEPVMLLHRAVRQAEVGDIIEVIATDPATTRDIPNFCRHLGHELLLQETLSVDDVDSSINSVDATSNIQASTHYRYLLKKC